MSKVKPFEIISTHYQISRESAKYFLGRVQKSFKKHKPPEQLIITFMEGQNFESLPEPYLVAAKMKESGIWVYPLNAEPPTLVDDADVYF